MVNKEPVHPCIHWWTINTHFYKYIGNDLYVLMRCAKCYESKWIKTYSKDLPGYLDINHNNSSISIR